MPDQLSALTFHAIADRLLAGEDYEKVLADYGLRSLTAPQGWKQVPITSTQAMIEAGANEVIAPIPSAGHKAIAVYKAMIAAAPNATPQRCIYEARSRDGRALMSSMEPYCQTHGFDCPNAAKTQAHRHGDNGQPVAVVSTLDQPNPPEYTHRCPEPGYIAGTVTDNPSDSKKAN